MDTWSLSMWVSPFRYPRLTGYLLLPAAFRSLSRLSSALSAKASALRPLLLNLFSALYGVPPPLYSVTGKGLFYFTYAAAFAATSVLPVVFRHLCDDGLGCLILFNRCNNLYCCFCLDIFRFSVFGFQGTIFYKILTVLSVIKN